MLVYDISRPSTFETVAKVSVFNNNAVISSTHLSLLSNCVVAPSPQWKEEIDAKVLLPNGLPIPVVLLGMRVILSLLHAYHSHHCNKGNKCDLDDGAVDKDQLDAFCAAKGFVGALDSHNCVLLFQYYVVMCGAATSTADRLVRHVSEAEHQHRQGGALPGGPHPGAPGHLPEEEGHRGSVSARSGRQDPEECWLLLRKKKTSFCWCLCSWRPVCDSFDWSM